MSKKVREGSTDLEESSLYESCYGYKESNSSFRFLLVILVLVLALFSFRIYFTHSFGGVIVSGSSMSKTLYSGEELLMRRVNEKNKAERGDVIVVYVYDYPEFKYEPVSENRKTRYLIKRLIAIEGDKVRCEDGKVEICYAGTDEFVYLDEPYAYYGKNDAFKKSYDFEEYTVQEGEVFFLGDNRSYDGSSVDSRYLEGHSRIDGLYKETDIYGVVPDWAMKYQKVLSWIFFTGESV